MAQPPKAKTIAIDPGADIPDWARKFKGQLDAFMTSVTEGLTKGLTAPENFSIQIKTLDFTTGDTVTASFPMHITCSLPRRPKRIDVGQAWCPSGGSFSGAVTANQFVMQDAQTIRLNNITGLNTNTRYNITLFID